MIVLAAMAVDGWAAPCEAVDLGRAADGVTAVAVRDGRGELRIVAATGSDVRLKGELCGDGAKVRWTREGDALVATVRRGEPGVLELALPAGVAAVTAFHHTGAVIARDLPARIAVVSSEGRVEASGVGALRVAYLKGDVRADGVGGDLVADHVEGAVTATAVAGSVVADDVTGAVQVDGHVVAATEDVASGGT